MMPRLTLRRCVCGSWHGTSLKEIMVRGASCRFTEISSRACRLVSGPWKMNIAKEKSVLGGLSVEYADSPPKANRLFFCLESVYHRGFSASEGSAKGPGNASSPRWSPK